MNYSNTISAIKKDLIEIKSRLNHIDLNLFLNDPDCTFGTKPYYSSIYYLNIKPDEAPNYIDRMQHISESIKLITDKLGLEYLLSEVAQIKELARISDETFHYSFFFDLYSLACKVEEYIEKQIKIPNLQQEDPILSKDQYNQLKANFIDGMDYRTLTHVMKYKQLPIGETKGTWKNNRPAEAARFCLLFSIKCSEWNKIFDLPGGKKLEDNNFPRVRDTDSETPTYKMIGKLCEIFPELAKAYK